MGTLYLSRDGHRKMKEQLDYLVKVKRKECTAAIEHARGFGDLRENAEYNAAKEAQALNEIKIRELSEKLSNVRIIDDMDIATDKAYIGATVRLVDLKNQDELEYTLVSESEADFLENKISIGSPIGKGLLGKAEGEEVAIQVPAGVLNYRVVKIYRGEE